MSIASADSAAKEVRLSSTTYTKLNVHLCYYCDSCFQRIQKISYPQWYEREVSTGNRPSINEKLRSIDGDGVYPHWIGLSRLRKAVEEGCHICRLFLSQLIKSESDRLADLDQKKPLQFGLRLEPDNKVYG